MIHRRDFLKVMGVGFSMVKFGANRLFAADDMVKKFKIKDPVKFSEAMQEIRLQMKSDPYRPIYHFLPPCAWFNDPNGPIYFRGKYHLFYQFAPMPASNKSITKCWGHALSDDLVHWKDLPVAMWPDMPYDQKGVLSGNTFIDDDGIPCAIYTGLAKGSGFFNEYKYGILARSYDNLLTWKKKMVMDKAPYEGSPTHHDAQIWKDGALWYQLIGGSWNDQGAAVLWSSPDLENWTYCNRIFTCGDFGKYWELPYLLPFGDKYVLLYGPGRYWVGGYDKKKFQFIPDNPEPKMLDYGPVMYAPNCHLIDSKGIDGASRRFALGWVQQGSPYQDIPYWEGLMWLPRIMDLKGDRLLQSFPVEIQALRGEHFEYKDIVIEKDKVVLNDISGDSFEIDMYFDLETAAAERFGLRLRVSHNRKEYARVYYDRPNDSFGVDGQINWGQDRRGRKGRPSKGPVWAKNEKTLNLRMFLDRSVLEVLINGQSQTQRIYPSSPTTSQNVEFFAEGGSVKIKKLDFWKINSIW